MASVGLLNRRSNKAISYLDLSHFIVQNELDKNAFLLTVEQISKNVQSVALKCQHIYIYIYIDTADDVSRLSVSIKSVAGDVMRR